VYNELQKFPRLGLVVYGDAFTLGEFRSDDFSVSIEKELTNTYSNVISQNYFLQSLEKIPHDTKKMIRSIEHGYFFNNTIYISNRTLENELYIPAPRHKVQINEKYFTDAKRISGKKITVCTKRNVIFVENKP